jgi:hypothetical protein
MHNYRLPALAPASRPQKRETHCGLFCWYFWVYVRGGVRVCIYTGFFLIVFSSPQNHSLYQCSRHLRVPVTNDQLTASLYTRLVLNDPLLLAARNGYVSPGAAHAHGLTRIPTSQSRRLELAWCTTVLCTWGQSDDGNLREEVRIELQLWRLSGV